jgi:hypothetical protein
MPLPEWTPEHSARTFIKEMKEFLWTPQEQLRALIAEAMNWRTAGVAGETTEILRKRILELQSEVYPEQPTP